MEKEATLILNVLRLFVFVTFHQICIDRNIIHLFDFWKFLSRTKWCFVVKVFVVIGCIGQFLPWLVDIHFDALVGSFELLDFPSVAEKDVVLLVKIERCQVSVCGFATWVYLRELKEAEKDKVVVHRGSIFYIALIYAWRYGQIGDRCIIGYHA